MATRTTTYEKIKELLNAKLETLSAQLDANRRISILKFKELKEDTEELKRHAKETNGHLQKNRQSIIILEEQQCQNVKRRKRTLGISFTALTAVFGAVAAWVVHKVSH